MSLIFFFFFLEKDFDTFFSIFSDFCFEKQLDIIDTMINNFFKNKIVIRANFQDHFYFQDQNQLILQS